MNKYNVLLHTHYTISDYRVAVGLFIGILLGVLRGAAAPPNLLEKSEIFRLLEI